MTTEQILPLIGAIVAVIGPLGSLLEMLGEAKKEMAESRSGSTGAGSHFD
jgi:hypothetical protein